MVAETSRQGFGFPSSNHDLSVPWKDRKGNEKKREGGALDLGPCLASSARAYERAHEESEANRRHVIALRTTPRKRVPFCFLEGELASVARGNVSEGDSRLLRIRFRSRRPEHFQISGADRVVLGHGIHKRITATTQRDVAALHGNELAHAIRRDSAKTVRNLNPQSTLIETLAAVTQMNTSCDAFQGHLIR
jgi:hypothetical protein